MRPEVPDLSERDILAIVVELQREVRVLRARQDQSEREIEEVRQGSRRAQERRLSLEDAGRRGILPRCPRTMRKWLATSESRALWKTDLFLRRIGSRIEVDLDGLEEWRRQMATPTTAAWPIQWGRAGKGPQ